MKEPKLGVTFSPFKVKCSSKDINPHNIGQMYGLRYLKSL